jgi:hypothetical protein
MKEYVTALSQGGLLNYDAYTRKFKTIEKGLRVLDAYNHMSDATKTEHNDFKNRKYGTQSMNCQKSTP